MKKNLYLSISESIKNVLKETLNIDNESDLINESIRMQYSKLHRYGHNQYLMNNKLYEKYGLLSYNKETHRLINKIGDNINRYLASNTIAYDTVVEQDPKYKFKKFSIDIDLTWLKTVDTYITKSLHNVQGRLTEDVMLLDERYRLIDKFGNANMSLIIKKDKVEKCSILFFYKTPINNIDDIIFHELKHLYDSYISKRTLAKINQDIAYTENIDYSIEDLRFVESLLSCNDKSMLEDTIKDIDVNNLLNIVLYYTYLLNESELQARLVNIKDELLHSKPLFYKKLNVSSNYRTYQSLYIIYKLIVKIVSDDVKRDFVSHEWFEYIAKYVYGYNKNIIKYYDTSTNISYNHVKTFDNFFNYFANQIYRKVLRHSASIYIENTLKNQKKY